MSKKEIIIAKELVLIFLSLIATVVLILLTLVLGKNYSSTAFLQGSNIIIAYFVGTFLYLNLAYLISSWLKKAGFAIAILFLYSIVIENLISLKLPHSITKFFPLNIIGEMIPNPFNKLMGKTVDPNISILNISVCFAYIALFIFLNYWMLKKGHAGRS